MDLTDRPRRLRRDGIREMVSETDVDASDLVAPVFVDATTDVRRPIETMPGHERVPVEESVERVEEVLETGVEAVMLFGIPESKDERGTRAWADDGVVQEATRRVTAETDAYVITDVCLCEYTSHGHCGVLEKGVDERRGEREARLTVKNDETLELLGKIATSHAEAGADMVAPSGMMVVADLREEFDHPIAAYNVSGEYAMLHAASEKGWLELEEVAMESLVSIKRAGADLILTYFAEDVAEML